MVMILHRRAKGDVSVSKEQWAASVPGVHMIIRAGQRREDRMPDGIVTDVPIELELVVACYVPTSPRWAR